MAYRETSCSRGDDRLLRAACSDCAAGSAALEQLDAPVACSRYESNGRPYRAVISTIAVTVRVSRSASRRRRLLTAGYRCRTDMTMWIYFMGPR
jgi:hypothetical protein